MAEFHCQTNGKFMCLGHQRLKALLVSDLWQKVLNEIVDRTKKKLKTRYRLI